MRHYLSTADFLKLQLKSDSVFERDEVVITDNPAQPIYTYNSSTKTWDTYVTAVTNTLTGVIENLMAGSRDVVADLGLGTGGGGSSLWADVAYSTSIPFDGNKKMPQTTVSSAITLTANTTGAAAGASCYIRLVSNGTHVPTFSGFTEDSSSHGWGAPNGTVNRVYMWYDGVAYYYAIQQEAGLPIVVPVLGTAIVPNAAPTTLELTYSVALDTGSVPATSAFSVTNSGGSYTVSSVAVSGSVATLTMSRAAVAGETITVSYTVPGTNPVKSTSGGLAAALSSQAVTNNVTATDGIIFQTLTGFAETETSGYKNYAATSAAWANNARNATKMLEAAPASDVYFQATVTGSDTGIGLHIDSTTNATVFTPITYFVYWDGGTSSYNLSSGGFTTNNAITPAAGDVVRFKRTNANTLTFEVSKDGGSTWTVRGTKTGVTGSLYPRVNCATTSPVNATKCNGAAAA